MDLNKCFKFSSVRRNNGDKKYKNMKPAFTNSDDGIHSIGNTKKGPLLLTK